VTRHPTLGSERPGQEEHQQGKRRAQVRHGWKIGTTILLAGTTIGCAPKQFGVDGGPSRQEVLAGLPPQAPTQLLFADRAGVSPPDTVVRFAASSGRTIVLRHAPPDNAVFAILHVPADSTVADSLVLTLRVTPGRYGLHVQGEPRLPANTELTFSYAIHFQAPPEVPSASHPTTTRYAEWLAIGRLEGNGSLRYFPTTRPGGDLLRTVLSEGGEYLIAAPVTPP
jgi:hypothetical protein